MIVEQFTPTPSVVRPLEILRGCAAWYRTLHGADPVVIWASKKLYQAVRLFILKSPGAVLDGSIVMESRALRGISCCTIKDEFTTEPSYRMPIRPAAMLQPVTRL